MGVEYMHIENPEERQWFQERMEPSAEPVAARHGDAARGFCKDVVEADGFEAFLDNRFKGHKRFSIEGGESTIAMIDELLERAAPAGVEECVIGMAHRGRLTVLANVIGKGIAQIFSEFEGDIDPDFEGSGDVKYHLGASSVRRNASGKEITVSVAANPSHLEAVNPVVEGIVRPKQDRLGDSRRERVIPVLIHGDAAMVGQGIVAETLNLSQIDGYNTGGTMHIVDQQPDRIHHQSARIGRSSTYCTDVALMVQPGVPRERRRSGSVRARHATGLRFPPAVPSRRGASTCSAGASTATTKATIPSYTQPVLYRKLRKTTNRWRRCTPSGCTTTAWSPPNK